MAVISAFVDVVGMGTGGFGWKQTLGVVVGAGAALVGGALALKGRSRLPRAE